MTKPLRTWWHELNTWEPEVALAFYHRTLGWEFEHTLLPDGESYWIALQAGNPVGGIYALREPEYHGIPSHWMTYLAVADIAEAERTAVFAGGEVSRPAVFVPGVGKLSVVADSTGEREATKVLVARAGDRTILFKALLDAAGVSNHWAYLRPRDALLPQDDGSHPRPDGFAARHLLVEGDPAGPAWVSLATRRLPFGKLPRSLQGGTAIVLGGAGGARLSPVPSQSLEDSTVATAAQMRSASRAVAERPAA